LRGVRSASVASDNVAGSRAVVDELLHAGHRRICILTCFPNTSTVVDRIQGYMLAHADAGVPVDFSLHYVVSDVPQFVLPDWEPASDLVDRFATFLKDHPDVTAVYATNTLMGVVALRAFARLTWQIPQDISLACVDLIEAIPLHLPPVSAALQQNEEIGSTAVTLLHEVLQGQPCRSVLLPMHLRDAGSIGPPAPWRMPPSTVGQTVLQPGEAAADLNVDAATGRASKPLSLVIPGEIAVREPGGA
jgi:DNA-binding LacI/PurR family transcriptional regulator